jgi:hypothetical protein
MHKDGASFVGHCCENMKATSVTASLVSCPVTSVLWHYVTKLLLCLVGMRIFVNIALKHFQSLMDTVFHAEVL